MNRLNSFLAIVLMMGLCALRSSSIHALAPQATDAPRFGADNELARPDNYREWIYLSSGIGMSYNAAANSAGPANPPFDNVFVTPSAYRSFLQTGTWPENTMFVLELRGSGSEASINRQGRFQQQVLGIEVEVKNSARFPGKWAFYEFGRAATAKPTATTASCYSCHAQNGAVDNTFVQFYPTLVDIARQKGTFKESTSVPRQ
jgi:Cytochrome P460